jgi:SAM-dependent methyltransferase
MSTNYFDGPVARRYDRDATAMFDPSLVTPAIDFLAARAGAGPVLELGIGTGRLALPLQERGVEVHGIDLSPEMLDELRRKPGADRLHLTVGDFATTELTTTFTLAYLAFNTITNLTSQDDQVACFEQVARHLAPDGRFVIECYVPELRRLPPGETIHPFDVTPTHLGFEEYDLATQIAFSHHYWLEEGTLRTFSAPFRYVWPSELDLMARLAGMARTERWASFGEDPFTAESRSHVSVWQRPS